MIIKKLTINFRNIYDLFSNNKRESHIKEEKDSSKSDTSSQPMRRVMWHTGVSRSHALIRQNDQNSKNPPRPSYAYESIKATTFVWILLNWSGLNPLLIILLLFSLFSSKQWPACGFFFYDFSPRRILLWSTMLFVYQSLNDCLDICWFNFLFIKFTSFFFYYF